MWKDTEIILVSPGELRQVGMAVRLLGTAHIKFTLTEFNLDWESLDVSGSLPIKNDVSDLDYKIGDSWSISCSKLVLFCRLIPERALRDENIVRGRNNLTRDISYEDAENNIPTTAIVFNEQRMEMMLVNANSLATLWILADYENYTYARIDRAINR